MDFARRCEHCGKVIPDDADPRRIYCTRRCLNAAMNGLTAEARREAKAGRICTHCGEPIPTERRVDALFCSGRCQSAARHARDRAAKVPIERPVPVRPSCPICGKPVARRGKTFCSRSCATRHKHATGKISNASLAGYYRRGATTHPPRGQDKKSPASESGADNHSDLVSSYIGPPP
ncbi:hypothetical protein [Rhodobacter sp. CZR27]|uniref:hypothetical protein n=1 Tax=Rhodobacter sp. CZR27 TaxID=2033869 RepID=UPI0012FD9224|nr:hypothetical protein [Rhodobacter sp. CZR27]